MIHARFPAFALLLFAALPHVPASSDQPPELQREFRGAWVASVYNLNWPSQPGLPVEIQQRELRRILENASELKLNALLLQVRPQCDALYASKREPWSSFLTGRMGAAPQPYYDPLEFAITEAHARGIELHAWFNPFRALANASAPASADHVSKRHPEWTRRYGNQLWLDPGEAGAREHALAVILDVVRRYDLDGVHLDAYFYPYQVRTRAGGIASFPDDASWGRYQAASGRLERDDWRRENIDNFVAQLYRAIKAEKRWVKFGISPFGIWRPGVPETIEADLDSFAHLYANSRRWLNEGWCDYFAPQLYWSIAPAKQSFPVLLNWWHAQNLKKRHVWPGIAPERIGNNRSPEEIVRQIGLTRGGFGSPGQIHWSMKSLMQNRGGISNTLRTGVYAQPALVPAMPWLGSEPCAEPMLARSGSGVSWQTKGPAPRWWLVQTRQGTSWSVRVLAGAQESIALEPNAEWIAVRSVNRVGAIGEPRVLAIR